MDAHSPASVEVWQFKGQGFTRFSDVVSSASDLAYTHDASVADFAWRLNMGRLKSQAARDDAHIFLLHTVTTEGFVQTQSKNSDDIIIIVPIHGRLEASYEGRALVIEPGHAFIYQALHVALVDHVTDDEGCEAQLVQISFAWVQRLLFQTLRVPVDRDIRLEAVVDLKTPGARVLAKLIATFCSGAFTAESRNLSPGLQQKLIETFSQLLLESVPHRYASRMSSPGNGPQPNYLRVAREYMLREAAHNPSMAEIARVANISVRTLETSFRTYLDVTPLAYLRALRLQMVRDALAARPRAGSIGETAAAFGFPHAGRFARYYTELFGESPSETLRNMTAD